MNTQNTGFGFLLPALMSPATATVLAIGVVGFGLMKLLAEDENAEDKPPVNRLADKQQQPRSSIQPNVVLQVKSAEPEKVLPEPAVEPLKTAVEKPDTVIIEPFETQLSAHEPDRGELIRRYMSELGKRSAAVRAAKKQKAIG